MTTTTEEQAIETTPEQLAEEQAAFNSVVEEPTDSDESTPVLPDDSTPPTKEPEPSSAVEKEPEPVKPKLAEISDEAFQKLLKSATEVDEIKAALEQRFNGLGGKIGGLERILQELKGAGTGKKAEVSRDDLKELLEEFPEFGEKALTGLNRAFSRIGGASAPTVTPEQLDKMLDERETKRELAKIEKVHKDWVDVVGPAINFDAPDAAVTPYWRWVRAQSPEYYAQMYSSTDSAEIKESITQFKATLAPKPQDKAEKPKGVSDRERQLRAAVQPRGAGGPSVQGAATDEDTAMREAALEEQKQMSIA